MQMIKKICNYCEKEFRSRNKSQIFCSLGCRYKSQVKQKIHKKCPICCKDFIPKSYHKEAIFCSNKCHSESKHMNSIIRIECKNCGKIFNTTPYYKDKKYCSRYCFCNRSNKYCICETCGKEFKISKSKRLGNRIFCSMDCLKNKKSTILNRNCKICGGKIFGNGRNKYCSIDCKKKGGIKHICRYCGNSFNSRIKKSKYCSRKCKDSSQIDVVRLNIRKSGRCLMCNKEFYPKLNKKFCENKCYSLYLKKPKIKKECRYCKKQFDVENKKKDKLYCSRECQTKHFVERKVSPMLGKNHSEKTLEKMRIIARERKTIFKSGQIPWNKNKKGLHLSPKTEFKKGQEPWNKGLMGYMKSEKNPNWMGGLSYEPYGVNFNKNLKEKIKERDNFTCQECSLIIIGNRRIKNNPSENWLVIHHIDYNKKNNLEFNLITLCSKCHLKTNYNREHWKNYFNMKIFIKELFNPQNLLIFQDNKIVGINKMQHSCKEEK